MIDLFIGVDPGASGGLAYYISNGDKSFYGAFKCPKAAGKLYEAVFKIKEMVSSFNDGRLPCPYSINCVVEKVHSMPGQGVKSTFSFGKNLGWWESALEANRIPYQLVHPRKWQNHFNISAISRKDRKKLLREKAEELYPDIKMTYYVSDAVLIMDYCKAIYG